MNIFKNKKAQQAKVRLLSGASKKAQGLEPIMKFIIWGAVALILIIIIRTQFLGSDKGLTDIRMSATNDYDGDGTKDNIDKAPCTFGDMKVLQQGEKDIFYPVQRPISYAGVTNAKDCPEKTDIIPNTYTCTSLDYEGKPLTCVLDRETEELYCAISESDCTALLKEEYKNILASK